MAGIFGAIKDFFSGESNPIKVIGDAVDKFVRTKEEKDAIFQAIAKADQELKSKLRELEVQDRASARQREVEMAKAGKADALKFIVGVIGMVAFIGVLAAGFFWEPPDKNIYYFIAGNVFGVASSIFAYYFGSSQGSKNKQETLDKYLDTQKK